MLDDRVEEMSHAALFAVVVIGFLALFAFVLAVLAVVRDALGVLP